MLRVLMAYEFSLGEGSFGCLCLSAPRYPLSPFHWSDSLAPGHRGSHMEHLLGQIDVGTLQGKNFTDP